MTAMHCVEEASSLTVALGEHNIRADIENHRAKVEMMIKTMMEIIIMMTKIMMMMILGEPNIPADIETLSLLTLHGQWYFDFSPLCLFKCFFSSNSGMYTT